MDHMQQAITMKEVPRHPTPPTLKIPESKNNNNHSSPHYTTNIVRPAIPTTNRPSSTSLIPPSSSQEEKEYTEHESQVARGKRSVNRPK